MKGRLRLKRDGMRWALEATRALDLGIGQVRAALIQLCKECRRGTRER